MDYEVNLTGPLINSEPYFTATILKSYETPVAGFALLRNAGLSAVVAKTSL